MGWFACLSLVVACGNSNKEKTPKVFTEKGLELSAMDTSVRPGDDFYNYVSGSWMKTAKILSLTTLSKRNIPKEVKGKKYKPSTKNISLGISVMLTD